MTDYSQEYAKHQEKEYDSSSSKSLPMILGLATVGMLIGMVFLDEPWELFTGAVGGVLGGIFSLYARK